MSENRKDWNTYIVYLDDPLNNERVRYDNIRAVSESHAMRLVRDAHFGPLYDQPDQIEMEVVKCP